MILFLGLLLSFNLEAQLRSPLCFEQESIDIGMVYMNDKSFAAFPFRNCSNETVIIERVEYKGERGKNVFNIPYLRDVDTILPNQLDTIKFWKRASHDFEEGPRRDIFTVRILGLGKVQELNIFSFVKANNGHLGINPIQVPTVARGEKVVFNPRIRNFGIDPVTVKIAPSYSKYLHRIDDTPSPVVIAPGQELVLTYELETKELLKNYNGSLSFETNEQGRYPRINIEYYGELISHDHPSMKFDSLLLHKNVDQSGDGNFEFWFENDGEAPLIIKSAKTS